jgi:hypothetical protein
MSISDAHRTIGDVIYAPSHLGRKPGQFFKMLRPDVQKKIIDGVMSSSQPAPWFIKLVCG